MATCPECSTNIEEDFGLVTCPDCGISLFIDMNGEAKSSEYTSTQNILQGPLSGVEESSNLSDFNGLSDPSPPVPEDFVFSQDDLQSMAYKSEKEFAMPEEVEEVQEDNHSQIDFSVTTSEELDSIEESYHQEEAEQVSEEEYQEAMAPEDEAHVQFEEDDSFDDEEIENDRVKADPSDLGDIAEFGNSSTSLASDGLLRYDILISGLDSSDLRRDFFEVINDKRFVWDTEKLMAQIQQGRIKLKDISAVKAMIIISRLRYMPVKVKWEQYAVNEI